MFVFLLPAGTCIADGTSEHVSMRTESSGQTQKSIRFNGRFGPVPALLIPEIKKYTWNPRCPVGLDRLALVQVSHRGFDGKTHEGRLIVHKDVAAEVLMIFNELFKKRFPIERIRPVSTPAYKGDDSASMADNNTSAFNCRFSTGSRTVYSKHSLGRAIDINPLINPYVKSGRVLPPGGKKYLDRAAKAMGIIVRGGTCYTIFKKYGWNWGGDWLSLKDYQHFEKP